TLSITNSTISGNIATGPENNGGGLDAENAYSTVHLYSDTITNNQAGQNGGGASIRLSTGGDLKVLNTQITNNSAGTSAQAQGNGGGMRIEGYGASTALIADSVISGNVGDVNDLAAPSIDETKGFGSGLYFTNAVTAKVSRTTISGNTAYYGGGVYIFQDANVTFENVTIAKNAAKSPVAPGVGGGVKIEGGMVATVVNFNETTIGGDTAANGNSAQSGGGGIDINTSFGPSTVTLYNSIVANNTGGANPDVANNLGTLNATY